MSVVADHFHPAGIQHLTDIPADTLQQKQQTGHFQTAAGGTGTGTDHHQTQQDGFGEAGTVETENIRGNIDINMAGGKAELIVDGNYRFDKVVKGRNNNIETDIEASPEAPFKVELNGKDSVLKITAK